MRALAQALVALVLMAAPAAAGEACAPADLDRFKATDMVADAELRAEAQVALEACAAFAQDQLRNTGEIEERVLVHIAALAGRSASATYAADEIPKPPAALVGLMISAFRQLYPHLRALPEEENVAAMRAIVFHLAEQAGPATTGSVRPPAPGAPTP